MQYVTFRVAEHDYALPIEHAQSIEPMTPITRLPGAAPFVLGLVHLRGAVLPVIDLRRYLGLPAAPWTEETRIVIVSVGDITAGLVVDAIHDVVEIGEDAIQPAQEVVGPVRAEQMHGVVLTEQGVLVLLDVARVLDPGAAVQTAPA